MKKIIIAIFLLSLTQPISLAKAQDPTPEQAEYIEQLQAENIKITPYNFSLSIQKGNDACVEKFLKAGISPNTKFGGEPAITTAIKYNQNKSLDLLLEAGADPNTIYAGWTQLNYAINRKNAYAVKQLIDYGADIKKSNSGYTPLQLADKKKNIEVIEIIQAELANEIKAEDKLTGSVLLDIAKKDPKLIIVQTSPTISKDQLTRKIDKDNKEYEQIKMQLSQEQYATYRVFEKIVRANNLEYQNWRFGFNLNPEEVNASASSANLLIINSSLYDSLYQNEDAIAFIISHELAHFLLGHHQISLENNAKIQQIQAQTNVSRTKSEEHRQMSNWNNVYGNRTAALGNDVAYLGYSMNAWANQKIIDNIYKQERDLEYQADKEAVKLMTRAGYNVNKGNEALEFLSNLPNVYTERSTHPPLNLRQIEITKETFYTDANTLKAQGNCNIYNSPVLTASKSMDKKTVVLNKPKDFIVGKYSTENNYERNMRLGYLSYCNNNMTESIKFFEQAHYQNNLNYVPALYISYANEYLYYASKDKRYLKQALKWARKATRISGNTYTASQKTELEKLFFDSK